MTPYRNAPCCRWWRMLSRPPCERYPGYSTEIHLVSEAWRSRIRIRDFGPRPFIFDHPEKTLCSRAAEHPAVAANIEMTHGSTCVLSTSLPCLGILRGVCARVVSGQMRLIVRMKIECGKRVMSPSIRKISGCRQSFPCPLARLSTDDNDNMVLEYTRPQFVHNLGELA